MTELPQAPLPQALAGIYSSLIRSACDERAFMLAAVGIASVVDFDGLHYSLAVDTADLVAAQAHLSSYEQERRAGQLPPVVALPPPRVHRAAWLGSVIYVCVLIGVAFAISNAWWPANAFEHGVLDAASVRSGQWWRAWTALTLHWDAAHLMANLGAGVWFGTLAARQLGSGCAWLLIVTGAAAANLFNARFGPDWYRSAGASTAVFSALGLMAAHSWRTRFHLPQRRVSRWAPLVAGVVLLGWFGTAGEGTDVVAHALGFVVGGLLGALAALRAVAARLERVPQWLTGMLALLSLAAAWACALRP
jgi:membrane associated rhomboid family serine protease